MKRLVALMMCATSVLSEAQVSYPYNPDENGDGLIAVGDLQGILSVYGSGFLPGEIMIDSISLEEALLGLSLKVDSLASLENQQVSFGDATDFFMPSLDDDIESNWESGGWVQDEWTPEGVSEFSSWETSLPSDGILVGRTCCSAAFFIEQTGGSDNSQRVLTVYTPEQSMQFCVPLRGGATYRFIRESGDWGYSDFVWTPIVSSLNDGGIEDSYEAQFDQDNQTIEIPSSPTIILRSAQCGDNNSPAGVNCHNLGVNLGSAFFEETFENFQEVKIFNAGTLYPDDPIFYSQEVRFFLNGDEFAVEPYRFLVLVHFEGDWYIQDDGKIDDN